MTSVKLLPILLSACLFVLSNARNSGSDVCNTDIKTRFCKSDFVLGVKIIAKEINKQRKYYIIDINDSENTVFYKSWTSGVTPYGEVEKLYPDLQQSQDVDMAVGQRYVISGRIRRNLPIINVCNSIVIPEVELSDKQLAGLRSGYDCQNRELNELPRFFEHD